MITTENHNYIEVHSVGNNAFYLFIITEQAALSADRLAQEKFSNYKHSYNDYMRTEVRTY